MKATRLDPNQVENVISFNVKVLLAATGKSQVSLADHLGVPRSSISVKLSGKTQWSVPDLVNTTNFLATTPDVLMSDSMMKVMNKMGIQQDSPTHAGATMPSIPLCTSRQNAQGTLRRSSVQSSRAV